MLVRFRVPLILFLAGLSFLPRISSQTEGQQDKRDYNLFNPTPNALLREFATDRPDKTESPFTVDVGHLQFEIDFLNYTCDRANAPGMHETLKALSIAPINVKVGLLHNADLQIVAQTTISNGRMIAMRTTGRAPWASAMSFFGAKRICVAMMAAAPRSA